jgi:hypothetical protein
VRFELTHQVDMEQLTEEAKCDGIFPQGLRTRILGDLGQHTQQIIVLPTS